MYGKTSALLHGLSSFIAPIFQPEPRKRRLVPRRRRALRDIPSHNQSFRSLRRAVNSGVVLPEPSISEKMRHRWFRDAVSWARLRAKIGQEKPGDAALLKAVAEGHDGHA